MAPILAPFLNTNGAKTEAEKKVRKKRPQKNRGGYDGWKKGWAGGSGVALKLPL